MPAARKLGVDHTTVSRRLTALEADVNERLVERSPRGAALTAAGAAILEHAERMEAEAVAVAEQLGAAAGPSGAVRLATPEAFGAFLVAPAAAALHAEHPGLELELVASPRAVNLTKREADMAVTLRRPTQGRLYTQKLVDYRIGLYASRDYLERHGEVNDLEELRRRPLVWYIDDLLEIPEMRYLSQVAEDAATVFRSTSIVAQQTAVASGLGVGVLHAFAAEQDPRLVRVLAHEVAIMRTYWLVLHADQRQAPRIRAVVDFLQDLVHSSRERF